MYSKETIDKTTSMYYWAKSKFDTNPSNEIYFSRYFNLCINNANDNSFNIEVRNEYLKECFNILDVYCDYIFLNEDSLQFIKQQQNKVLKAADNIINFEYDTLIEQLLN
ncbi:MAG: hypothetical protein RSG52_05960 [Terrisporobacter sp.]|uniref:hypothetical protein n=1 Tax=Terrisporobacter sp. TaxID=1965305 RepID=UPI002FC7D755